MEFLKQLDKMLADHKKVLTDPKRKEIIRHCVANHEVVVSKTGALVSITPPESTGRSPKDTYIVKNEGVEGKIDWDSPNNIPLDPETFDMILEDSLNCFKGKEKVYITNRVIGADSSYALPVRSISDKALSVLFTDNMFRPVPKDISKSIFADRPFTLILLPYDKLDRARYENRLRKMPDGKASNMVVVADFVNRIGVVFGSAYLGSSKKLMFTAMNYLLPEEGILPIHCSANEGKKGDLAIFSGLSGTGKTTLSADPNRALLGDDEHGWSDNGIANFEYGCYAKLINLDPTKEPEIYHAITKEAPYEEHGSIVENAMMYPPWALIFMTTA